MYLSSFRAEPFPVFTLSKWRVCRIEKKVFLVHGENTVVIRYQVSGDFEGRPCCT